MNGWRDWILGSIGMLLVAGIIGGINLAIAQGRTDEKVNHIQVDVKRNDTETKQSIEKVDGKVDEINRNVTKLLVKMGVDPSGPR